MRCRYMNNIPRYTVNTYRKKDTAVYNLHSQAFTPTYREHYAMSGALTAVPSAVDAAPAQPAPITRAPASVPSGARAWFWGPVLLLYDDHELRKAAGKPDVICILCNAELSYKGSTGNVSRHVTQCHPDAQAAHKAKGGPMDKHVAPVSLKDYIVRWMVQTYQPLSAVEHESFKSMIAFINPKAPVPSREQVVDWLRETEATARRAVKSMLTGESVALTSDAWTSASQDPYLSMTVHYIDSEWQLVSLPLECAAFGGSHTAVRIMQKTEQLLARNNISEELVSALVIDNAANVQLAGALASFDSVPCAPHTLQLTVKQILEDPAVAKLLRRVRKIVGAFKHSSLKVEELVREQEQLGLKVLRLIQDVKTRWASTYLMLVNFLKNRQAIAVVCMRHKYPAGSSKRARIAEPAALTAAPTAAAFALPDAGAAAAANGSRCAPEPAASSGNRTLPATTRLSSGALARKDLAEKEHLSSEDDYSSSDDGSVDIGFPSPEPEPEAEVIDVDEASEHSGSSEADDSSSDGAAAAGKGKAKPKRASSAGTSSSSSSRGSSRGRGRGRGLGRGRGRGRADGKSASAAAAPQQTKQTGSKRKHDKHMAQLQDNDWDTLQLLHDILKPFYDAQTLLEGELYVTSSWVPFHVKKIRQQLVEGASCGDDRIEAVATLLLRDFNVRWGAWPRSTLISVALDPRTKKMKCFTDAEQLNAWALIKKEMHAMYTVTSQQQQQQKGGSSGAAAAATGSTSNVGSGSNAERSVLDDLLGDDSDDSEDHALDTVVDAEYVLQQRIESEVKLYKTLPKLGSSHSDNPLAWWSSHARDYPLLAAVARKWLAVPASSAASERVFSSAGLTVSNKRTRLRVDIVSILVFLKTAWPTLERAGVLPGSVGKKAKSAAVTQRKS